jgi:leucyl-tRNA synthetase
LPNWKQIGAGKAKVNFRMRDAIFGRQRYWGEPVPVYFKDGLPYLISEASCLCYCPRLINTCQPKAANHHWAALPTGNIPRDEYELSTMPGWAGSSWYWYRYMDANNDSEFASEEAIAYWKDVDLYIGGSEHATGHLLYSRFWNKFLKDIGKVNEEEPLKS